MGGCLSSYRVKNVKRKLYQLVPIDINQYDPCSQDKFQFQVLLTNVKIQSVNNRLKNLQCGVSFNIPGSLQTICQLEKTEGNKIKWNETKKVILTLNSYEIRSKFLKIIIIDSQHHMIDDISINLFRIANGPFHHDFKIKRREKQLGRLIFDFKMTQIATVKLECLSNQINFFKEYLGQKYSFLLDFYNQSPGQTRNRKIKRKTNQSYIYETPLQIKQRYRLIGIKDEAPSPTLRVKRTASKLIKTQSYTMVTWRADYGNIMPKYQLKVKISDLMSSNFTVRVLRHSTQKNIREFGNCTVLLSEIINYGMLFKGGKQKEDGWKNIQLIQKNLWHKGKKIGKSKLTILVSTNKIFKQMYGQTQTQDGIINMSHLQQLTSADKKQFNDEFFNTIQQIERNITILNNFKINQNQMNKQNFVNINKQFSIQINKLHKALTQNARSSISYITEIGRKNEKQVTLTNLLRLMSLLIGQQNVELNKFAWENVAMILRRPQMKLKYWQFNNSETKKITNGQSQLPNEIKDKVNLCTEFYGIQCQLLKLALDTQYLATDQLNQSAEQYKAFCYFKNPIFRETIINKISQITNKQIVESHSLQQLIQNIIPYEQKTGENIFTIIDQNSKIFRIISSTQRGQEINKNLQQFLLAHPWIKDFGKGDSFYDFICYAMKKFISAKQITSDLGYFPGYSALIAAFVQSMKDNQITNYSTSLISCASYLIQNHRLIQPILKILYTKTNTYNVAQVEKLITILFYIFHKIPKTSNQNAAYFPYKYFMQGIKIILDSQSTLNLGQILILFYNNYETFHVSFRFQLSMFLLGKKFWNLKYHWSFNIRHIIDHIIILRICQDTQLLTTTNIEQRIDEIYKILANGERIWSWNNKKNQIINDKILHKKMKVKLQEKMKFSANNINKLNYNELTQNRLLQHQKIFVKNYNNRNSKQSQQTNVSYQNYNKIRPKSSIYDTISQQSQSPQKYSKCSPPNHSIRGSPNPYLNETIKKSFSLVVKPILPFSPKYFKPQQLIIPTEIPSSVSKYLSTANKEFKQICKLVDQHFIKNQTIPNVNLGLIIEVDQKQMLPSQEDFTLLF